MVLVLSLRPIIYDFISTSSRGGKAILVLPVPLVSPKFGRVFFRSLYIVNSKYVTVLTKPF